MTRFAAILCLLSVTALLPAPAWARGADAREVGRNLVQRGYQLLRRAEGRLARGDKERAARDAREAERIFATVLNQEPGNTQAALLGGQAATLAGDRRAAAQWVQRMARIAPAGMNDPDYHYLIAFVQLLGDKRPERALRSLTRMYSLNPRARPTERDNLWYRAVGEHGRNLVRAERHDDAITQFRLGARIAKRLGNRDYEFLMLANIGVTLVQADRYIEATEVYGGLAKAQPKNPLWRFRLAICNANQSRFAQAVPDYRQVIQMIEAGHTYPGWERDLGQVKLRLGNCLRHLAEQQRDPRRTAELYTESETLIRAYMKAAPKDSLGPKWLAVLLFENLNKPYEALPFFEQAFDMDPICDDVLRYILQIRRTFPPPKGTTEKDWRGPIAKLTKDLEEGLQRRDAERKRRKRETGSNGCN
ncbi:MAG: tetratricopeptide repeat protein [Planctomycetota bacterium]|nr:tetratricopeptide repeat protein [Planctomycetota bacterium]